MTEVLDLSPAPGAAGRLSRLSAQTAMELRLLSRNAENLLVTFGIPLGILVFFSLIDVLPTSGEEPVAFLTPGVLALSVMSASLVALAISTGFERSYLVLKRLGATPLRRSEIVGAKILAIGVVEVVQVAVVLAVAVALGFRLTDPNLWIAPVAVVLGNAAFGGIGLAMAGGLRALGTLAIANAVYLFLLLLGGIAFPLDRLPGPLEAFAHLLPSAALADALRAALGVQTATPVLDLVVLAVWALAAVTVAVRVFRWE